MTREDQAKGNIFAFCCLGHAAGCWHWCCSQDMEGCILHEPACECTLEKTQGTMREAQNFLPPSWMPCSGSCKIVLWIFGSRFELITPAAQWPNFSRRCQSVYIFLSRVASYPSLITLFFYLSYWKKGNSGAIAFSSWHILKGTILSPTVLKERTLNSRGASEV